MFHKKHCMSTDRVWLRKGILDPGVPVDIRWGLRWAHIYIDGKKLGKILRSAAKRMFTEI